MIGIDTRTTPVPAPQNATRVRSAGPPASWPPPVHTQADDASSLPSASSLRVRIAAAHDESIRLERATSITDSTDESLARTEGLLARAHQAITLHTDPIDGILSAIDEETARPRVDGVAVLHEGFTLSTARGDLDIRPMNTASLGAVIDSGRSHRLSDLRSGGTLDPRTNPGAALRSTDGAMREVSAMRSQLSGFRASVLMPAQAETLVAARSAAGAGPVTPDAAEGIAIEVRTGLATGRDAPAFANANPQKVLNLLA